MIYICQQKTCYILISVLILALIYKGKTQIEWKHICLRIEQGKLHGLIPLFVNL